MIKLSVIIVNYNVQYFLEQCLISVQAASKNIVSEIIVVDNNSGDESCTMILQKFPSVQLIENKDNIGFSKSNNQGVAVAEGEYVLILNPDTVIAEDTLEKVLLFADQQENLGAIGVQFIDGTGNFLPECKRNIPTIEIASRKLMGDSKKYYASQIKEEEVSKVEVLTGAFMLLKRDIYNMVGGFDEDYFMFGEDIDLSYKLLNKGLQNYYYGASTIIHYKGESTIKDRTYLKNFYGAMELFYGKHFKSNVASRLLSKIAIKTLVSVKSAKLSDKNQIKNVNAVLLIGKDSIKYERLKLILNPIQVDFSDAISDNFSDYDRLVFDGDLFSFKEIINNFKKLKSYYIQLRIIPGDTSFYIGSDTSIGRGEIVEF